MLTFGLEFCLEAQQIWTSQALVFGNSKLKKIPILKAKGIDPGSVDPCSVTGPQSA